MAFDHDHAALFAKQIATIPGVVLDPASVETNLVFFEIDPSASRADVVSRLLAERGVRIYSISPQRLRACTHLDVTAAIPGIDAAKFQELAGQAKAGCPISKLLNATITMDAKLAA